MCRETGLDCKMRSLVGAVAFFVLVQLVYSKFLDVDVDVQEQCIFQCHIQNHSEVQHYGDEFGRREQQCEEGCRLWRSALNSSCQEVCDGSVQVRSSRLSAKELYCIIGCKDAVNRYYTELRKRLGTPPAPALVADSLTGTSLRLEWNFPEAREAGLRYFLQWKFQEHDGAWQYCRNQSWGPEDTVFVDNLQPYTKYKFRVTVVLSNLTEPILSPPSVVISTRPEGVPACPPNIVRAVAIDSTRISVSWEPGPFPHGPLLSYVLRITDNQPQGYSALKDVPADQPFYIFKMLTPERNYTVQVNMLNGAGEGPPANAVICTPEEPKAKDSEKPVLILSGHHIVIEQGTAMLDEPVILYNSKEFINGLAIHVSKQLLFVSDSARYVHRMPLHKYTNVTRKTSILTPSQVNFTPQDLSMDWLNEHLYILGEVERQSKAWQIARCNLDGRGLTIAIAGLMSKPHHIEVDPYNGYLFWVNAHGLYRLDLADISNGIKHEVQPELILSESNLGAFTVDHTNFRVLVSNQNNNTINSVSLDGKEVYNMREKIITSRLQKVVSLALANDRFYWTNGNEVLYEEYHPASDSSFFHNSYPLELFRSYIKVLVNLTSSQPTPVPVNPPTCVQAIFGTDIAKTTWQTPHLLGGQGKGAWQNWSYEIVIREFEQPNIPPIRIRGINSTSYTINNLKPNTNYVIKTAAYTSFGRGPGSTEFIGRTLQTNKDGNQPVILWSSMEGLLKSDASGENVETAIHKSHMSDHDFTHVAWYKNELYLVTDNLKVLWYNMKTHHHAMLNEIDAAKSIAIDWLGEKLYWLNPKLQIITRGNLNGTQQEPLLHTMATELNIDSIRGYLYWSTGLAVECARLNGDDKFVYHPAAYFSGKQVVGLTLDKDHHYVYWILQGLNSSSLYRARMAGTRHFQGDKPKTEEIAVLQPNIKGPLCYFNNRLIWLKNNETAIISDLEGKYTASIRGNSLLGLNMMYVMDSSHNIKPNVTRNSTIEGISVIPEAVDKHSVNVVGEWDSFNITWQPVQNVNYGTVFYEIIVDNFSRNNSTAVTTYPTLKYTKNIDPYTNLQITLRAYTYWGSSPPIKVRIHSPPSTPSAPRNLRTFVIHQHNDISPKQLNITFRWDTPANSNGILEGYRVSWWYLQENVYYNDSIEVDASEKEYIVIGALKDTTYYFQVNASTEIGGGDLSNVLEVDTKTESPIPTLLIASPDSIYIQDIDTNQNYTLMHGISTPIEMGYLIRERKVFWINDMQELLMYNLATYNRSKVFTIDGNVISLTVDWLERSLYYLQIDDTQGSFLYKVDLNYYEKTGSIKCEQVFRTPSTISKIEVSPFTKKIYWIESDSDKRKYRLMQANTDGTNMTSFFSQRSRSKRDSHLQDCNCPIHPSVGKAFTIDHSLTTNLPQIVYVDSLSRSIVSSDKYGCICTTLVNNTSVGNSYPIPLIKSDLDTIYWVDKTKSLLYSVKKHIPNSLVQQQINARDLSIFGQHMQPYPARKCLMPMFDQSLTVSLKNKTSSSLILKMPEYETYPECVNVSMATIRYKVFYMPYNEGEETQCDESCTQNVTFNKTMVITRLRPYSKYIFSVGLSNYYSNLDDNKMFIGPGVVFHTAAGAPSHPKNVVVTVLNPNLAKVTWEPPDELNGNLVYYEIHNEGFISGIRQKGEKKVTDLDTKNATFLSADINTLVPNENYTIWVRAYSETNETWSNSKYVQIRTFPEPENLTLIASTASSLKVAWSVSPVVEKFVIQYALLTSNDWIDLNCTQIGDGMVEMSIIDLKPKTLYKFRLLLNYPQYEEIYVWPKDARFSFETLGDKPSPPGVPIVQHIKDGMYQVWWEASKDNGAPIEIYMLETLKTPNYRNKRSTNRTAWFSSAPSVEEPEVTWESIYNGTDTVWKINGLPDEYRYAFRVSSLNSYGWSDLSEESMQFDPTMAAQITEKQDLKYLIGAISVPILIVLIIAGMLRCCKNCCTKNTKDQHTVISLRGPDVELATLRELPRRVNFIQNSNILYISTLTNTDDLNLLPHIRRDQITLTTFLGSGAFGEVFQGKAKGLNGNAYETKVAVKTLRKGASEQEKTEFLQEAHLMSHFKHEHILQLLGVCLDNDPHFIIMELMQGGDLLTYLRSSRKAGMETPPLNLLELLKMCVDVAKGCRYLEEMHFVHRDLACRNCLVSSTDPERRIVKIGDFGLARDIYKNDYYRKEGEGLLPVRWMAPESLVDGVFTCQSDVWSFGVLLWEIMTLGQQPYPARNNLEVLHYVRRGGRLGKPTDCPVELYELMLICWRYDQDGRPTFKYCLDALERLHLQAASQPMTGAHVGQYISTVPQQLDGISNQAYFQDENHNNSGASWKSGSEDDSSRERTPFLPTAESQPSEIPKYLELLYDTDSPVENDGYEIPRTTKFEVTAEQTGELKSDSGVADCDNFNKVVSELTSIEYLLKESNLGYTNMNSEQNGQPVNPKEDRGT